MVISMMYLVLFYIQDSLFMNYFFSKWGLTFTASNYSYYYSYFLISSIFLSSSLTHTVLYFTQVPLVTLSPLRTSGSIETNKYSLSSL